MSDERIVISGELHLSLEAVAACYRVDVTWLREVHELGLLGRVRRHREVTVVSARMLDRVAEVVRLHEVYHLEPSAMVLVLAPADD